MLTMKFAVALAAVHTAAVLLSVASAQIYNASFVPYTFNKELLVWPISTLVLSGEVPAGWKSLSKLNLVSACRQARRQAMEC